MIYRVDMLGKNKIKLFLVVLFSVFISACATQTGPLLVPLSKPDNAPESSGKNKNLNVIISSKLPDSSGIGGDSYLPSVQFQHTTTWLKSRLSVLNNLNCSLANKTRFTISIDKLYTYDQNETFISELVLIGKIRVNQHTQVKHYRAVCEGGFMSGGSADDISDCMNSAMDDIVEKMQLDLCR